MRWRQCVMFCSATPLPPQTASDCTCCHRLQSRQSQTGCCFCRKSPGATAGPGSSVWSPEVFAGPECPRVLYSSWASPRSGGCSWVPSPGGDGWPAWSSSGSPPPGASAGWARAARCWSDVSALPSAPAGCKWEWWRGWWAGRQTTAGAGCRHTQCAPPPRCPCSVGNRTPWGQKYSESWRDHPVGHLARRGNDNSEPPLRDDHHWRHIQVCFRLKSTRLRVDLRLSSLTELIVRAESGSPVPAPWYAAIGL